MSSVFIDSNVIIRYFAGGTTAKSLLKPIFYGDEQGYINNIVFSEVIFVVIKLLTGRKAYELKKKPEIVKNIFDKIRDHILFLQQYFDELEINEEIKQLASEIIRDHGLLPNDSLIAATCKHYGISTIATFDEDFKRIPWLKVVP